MMKVLELVGDEHTTMSLPMAQQCFAQIALGVCECHAAGIAHRDIKPNNVLLTGISDTGIPLLALSDLGLAERVKSQMNKGGELGVQLVNTHPGTFATAAPELLRGDPTDPFAAGASLFCALPLFARAGFIHCWFFSSLYYA